MWHGPICRVVRDAIEHPHRRPVTLDRPPNPHPNPPPQSHCLRPPPLAPSPQGEGGVTIEKQDDAFEDTVQRHLQEISKLPSLEEAPVTAALSKAVVDDLKKRKMVSLGTVSYYAVTKVCLLAVG